MSAWCEDCQLVVEGYKQTDSRFHGFGEDCCEMCHNPLPICDGCGKPFESHEDFDNRHNRSDGHFHETCCPECSQYEVNA